MIQSSKDDDYSASIPSSSFVVSPIDEFELIRQPMVAGLGVTEWSFDATLEATKKNLQESTRRSQETRQNLS
jgi:hypothetical protein